MISEKCRKPVAIQTQFGPYARLIYAKPCVPKERQSSSQPLTKLSISHHSLNSGPQSSENAVFVDGRSCADFGPFRRVAQQPEGELMPTLTYSLPPLPFPAFAGTAQKTYAAWPVWSDSTTKEIKYQPLPRKAATRHGIAPATSTGRPGARTTMAAPWGTAPCRCCTR
jgi:hypothetical protein